MKPELGPQFAALKYFVGQWKTTMRMRCSGPDGPATETAGATQTRLVLDGRLLQEDFAGEMVMPGPDGKLQHLSFQGLGLTGFDISRNLYFSTWTDNMGGGLMVLRGSVDGTGKVFTYYGEMDDPQRKIRERMVKTVVRIAGDNKYTFEMHDLYGGETPMFEIAYERK